jgi:hypothetical protein
VRIAAGSAFLVLGLLGLVLPILQGLLFLAIGIAILAPAAPPVRRAQNRLYRRLPRAKALVERASARFRRRFVQRKRGPPPPRLVLYITAHGYGHGVRTCDTLRRFCSDYPDTPVTVVSDLPEAFFRSRVPDSRFDVRAASFDVGLVQHDALRADLPASLDRLLALRARADALEAREQGYLRSSHAGLVVADIPGLPLRAAARFGLPAVAVGNFTWDWIYEPFAERDERWMCIVEWFRRDYAAADRVFRLPFSGDMSAFRGGEDVPLLNEPCEPRREKIAAAANLSIEDRWVLVGFASLDWEDDAIRALESIPGTQFLALSPLDWAGRTISPIDRNRFSFSEVLASCDIVLTKPGYGIVAECVANRKRMVYAERKDFRETPFLEAGIRRYLAAESISVETLYRGAVGPALDAVSAKPFPEEKAPLGGSSVLAHRFANLLAGR